MRHAMGRRLLIATEVVAAVFLLLIALLTAGNVMLRDLGGRSIADWYDGSRMLQGIALFWGIALTTYYGKANGETLLSGGTFSPRQWNGTVYYTKTQTCASEGYTGTKLTWCQNICEKGYTGATLDMWIHRWVNRYRDLPYCGLGEEEGPPQEG